MRIEVTYIADDGKKFKNEDDCRKYEQEQKRKSIISVQEEMCRLDDLLWSMFYPQDTSFDTSERKLHTAYIWLTNDIQHILLDPKIDRNDAETKIMSTILKSVYGEKILKHHINWYGIRDNVRLRSDFASALRNVRYGSDLASTLSYCLSKLDLQKLATLHKEKKYRKKIEDLLTACDFHSDCSQFISGNYEEYLL